MAPDGTVRGVGVGEKGANAKSGADLRSFDGEEWTVRLPSTKDHRVFGVEIQPDGSVWASWIVGGEGIGGVVGRLGGRRSVLGRVDENRWQHEAGSGPIKGMWAAGDELWVGFSDFAGVRDRELGAEGNDLAYGLVFHDGRDWLRTWRDFNYVDPGNGGRSTRWVEVGPDGTVWAALGKERLVRIDDGGRLGSKRAVHEDLHDVGPDGSLWAVPDGGSPPDCSGIVRFDGGAQTEYLRGHCVRGFDIAPDGTIWLQAREVKVADQKKGRVETYVIRP